MEKFNCSSGNVQRYCDFLRIIREYVPDYLLEETTEKWFRFCFSEDGRDKEKEDFKIFLLKKGLEKVEYWSRLFL